MIAIIDYDMGNIGSVYNMLKKIGKKSIITRDASQIIHAEKLILPGVGAFDSGMEQLEKYGLVSLITEKVRKEQSPILGICLGAQLLLSRSEEGTKPGLGLIDGEVVRFNFEGANRLRVPNMGWRTTLKARNSQLVDNLPTDPRFYFVHSYHFKLQNPNDQLLLSEYGYAFCAAFEHQNIAGVQFHPEKSHKFGMSLLRNFAEI